MKGFYITGDQDPKCTSKTERYELAGCSLLHIIKLHMNPLTSLIDAMRIRFSPKAFGDVNLEMCKGRN